VPTLARYLEALHGLRPDLTLTVVVPEVAVRHWWHRPLHTNTRQRLRWALGMAQGIVITSVPIHIPAKPRRARRGVAPRQGRRLTSGGSRYRPVDPGATACARTTCPGPRRRFSAVRPLNRESAS
jgi:hypothetical protein